MHVEIQSLELTVILDDIPRYVKDLCPRLGPRILVSSSGDTSSVSFQSGLGRYA